MIEIKRAKNKEYFFIVKARNGKTLVTSETYKRKASAYKAIRAVIDICDGKLSTQALSIKDKTGRSA